MYQVKQDMLDRMIELGDQLLDLDPDSISELQVQEVETYRYYAVITRKFWNRKTTFRLKI